MRLAIADAIALPLVALGVFVGGGLILAGALVYRALTPVGT